MNSEKNRSEAQGEKIARTKAFRGWVEEPAFLWELARRTKPEAASFPPWSKLPEKIQKRIAILWHGHPAFHFIGPLQYTPYRIEDPAMAVLELPVARELEHMENTPSNTLSDRFVIVFDMAASDARLKAAFMNLVNHERKVTGIPKPPKNKGNRSRYNPWGYIEVLDGEGKYDESSAASMRSKARRKLSKQITETAMSIFSRVLTEMKRGRDRLRTSGKRKSSRKSGNRQIC